ncbi:50S ribosomal protein L9 [bacterium]|nr:MAG: 50S ribosomal protein L9 [bacterium]
MKVILKESVANLGTVGDIVTVRDGYGRNYLIPQGLAYFADPKKVNAITHQKKTLEAKRKREMDRAEELARELEGLTLTFARKTADGNHIFGSVTPAEIEKAIHEKGFAQVTRKQVSAEVAIKHVGEFDVAIKLHGGVKAKIKVVVEEEK